MLLWLHTFFDDKTFYYSREYYYLFHVMYLFALILHYNRVTYIKLKMKPCRFTGTNVNRTYPDLLCREFVFLERYFKNGAFSVKIP